MTPTVTPAPEPPNAEPAGVQSGYAIPDDDDAPRGPVGLGDRLRRALASGDHAEPLYPRVLGLRHVHPNAWQRALLVEGMMVFGGLVALADKATSWAPLIMPVAAAAVVKFHDVLAGLLPPRPGRRADETPETTNGGVAR